MPINWKEMARHQRHLRRLAEQHEINLKRQLGSEHSQRARLVNTLADILTDIAYCADDPEQTYCNVCHRHLAEEGGHQSDCLYVLGLAVIAECGRSVGRE